MRLHHNRRRLNHRTTKHIHIYPRINQCSSSNGGLWRRLRQQATSDQVVPSTTFDSRPRREKEKAAGRVTLTPKTRQTSSRRPRRRRQNRRIEFNGTKLPSPHRLTAKAIK